MAFSSKAQKMEQMSPSEHDAALMAALEEVSPEALEQFAEIIQQFTKVGYKRICYATLFAAEDKTPLWMGGKELPEILGQRQTPQARTELAPAVQNQKPLSPMELVFGRVIS